jgi:hypothetical protein
MRYGYGKLDFLGLLTGKDWVSRGGSSSLFPEKRPTLSPKHFFLREKILNILIQFRTRNAYGAARAHSNKDPCSYLQRGFFLSCGMETKMDSKKEV